MTSYNNLADPKYWLSEIIENGLLAEDTFFIGCLSFEDRCMAAAETLLKLSEIPLYFIKVDDDECTYPPWKKDCDSKTKENWKNLLSAALNFNKNIETSPFNYKMSSRAEDILNMKTDLHKLKKKFIMGNGLRCLLDITCMPSYFSFPLIKYLIEDQNIEDLIILYTKPEEYPPQEEALKTSPFDITHPSFLPSFSSGDVKIKKANWIVGIGFDYDSVKNAERIKEVLDVEQINILVPFPAYRPEYVFRTMKENSALLELNQDFWFAPADNPFRTFKVISGLVRGNERSILSSFGPKPMSLGFCLAGIKHNLKILHVQATNYNPKFSIGDSETFTYWIKFKGNIWWDKIYN
jgi:hypothetical protein